MRKVEVPRDVFRQAEGLARLADLDLDVLARCVTSREYDAGEVVFREGDPGDTLMLVVSGSFLAFTQREAGEELLNRMQPFEIAGEMAFLDPAPRSATVRAETLATASFLGRDAMEVLNERAPRVVSALVTLAIRDVTRRLRALDRRVDEALQRGRT